MQHPSARRAETRPGRVAKQSVQLHASCSRTLYGAGVHRLACLPTNQRGRLCIRTNSSGNGRNLNLDKFEWIVVGSFGGGQTDLVVIVAFVHRSCRERLWQSVPLRRTRCRFDSVEFWRHVTTKFRRRNNNRLSTPDQISSMFLSKFRDRFRTRGWNLFRVVRYCAGTYFTESPVQTENLAGYNEQVWTTGVDIYIYI